MNFDKYSKTWFFYDFVLMLNREIHFGDQIIFQFNDRYKKSLES